jgi:hypothetical protein
MTSENGTATENELDALIKEGALGEKEGVVWMTRWNGPDAKLARKHGDVYEFDVFRWVLL